MEPEKITAIINNFAGKIIQTHYASYSDKNSTAAVIMDIKDVIDQIILKESIPVDKIAGIGIGISAQVDSDSGIIYKCEGIKLTKVHLKDEISKYFPYPISIINDVNASLLAEKWFVHDPHDIKYENFMYLLIGSTLQNMGLGLYLNNQLYEGSNHHAGEMYYYLTDKRLKSSLPPEEELLDFTIDKVKDFLNDDYEPVKKLLAIYTDIISEKMIHSIELLNPQKLIIGGNVINAEEEFLNPLIDAIKSKTDEFFEDFLQIEISKSELDELATPMGATTLIMAKYFK
ncbi:ROK family protein [Thiospirochaeta perfilievii]|nr:ROK family protein [Thiospirochaeta perfilievii]